MASFLDKAALAVEELAKCSRCGRCQAVCPVYLATGQERLVARGKLALIEAVREGQIEEPSAAFVETISRCLLCGACRDFCARSVPTDALIQQVRVAAAGALGLPRFYSLLFAGLSRPALLGLASRAGHLVQALSGIIPGAEKVALLPWLGKYAGAVSFAPRPFLSGREQARVGPAAVGLFVGCGANYLYPEAARAALALLEAAGVRVAVPEGQVCCGLPAWSAGDAASAEELERRNTAAFEGCEAVVALCASCAHRLRGYTGLPEVRLLPELLGPAPLPGPGRRLRVAYHAPCHVRFEPPGTGPMLRLLRSLPQVELVAAEAGCCGSGGLFGLRQPELSGAILRERLRELLSLAPEAIVTDCSGCLIQLRAGLAELGRPIPVVHPAALLAGEALPAS